MGSRGVGHSAEVLGIVCNKCKLSAGIRDFLLFLADQISSTSSDRSDHSVRVFRFGFGDAFQDGTLFAAEQDLKCISLCPPASSLLYVIFSNVFCSH